MHGEDKCEDARGDGRVELEAWGDAPMSRACQGRAWSPSLALLGHQHLDFGLLAPRDVRGSVPGVYTDQSVMLLPWKQRQGLLSTLQVKKLRLRKGKAFTQGHAARTQAPWEWAVTCPLRCTVTCAVTLARCPPQNISYCSVEYCVLSSHWNTSFFCVIASQTGHTVGSFLSICFQFLEIDGLVNFIF